MSHPALRRYPKAFGKRVAALMPKLLKHRKGIEVDSVFRNRSALDIFQEMSFGDMVEDGLLRKVACYLRGQKALRIPEVWRPLLPTEQ